MLSEEEKEVIKFYSNGEVSFSVDFDTEKLLKALGIIDEDIEEDSFEKHQIRFKTLLNLITRLEKENEDIQNKKEHQELRFKKYKENIEKQHEEIYEDLVSKLEEKDKQIDLMAEFINKQDIDEDICKNNISDLCDEYGTGINCIKCIKQYFENKAKGE